ncbi:hypothetical protein [Cyanobium gracile]|nr:hypothetical protein [Cyanobium gracile]
MAIHADGELIADPCGATMLQASDILFVNGSDSWDLRSLSPSAEARLR